MWARRHFLSHPEPKWAHSLPRPRPAPASAAATFSKQICRGRELITQHILPDIDVTDSKWLKEITKGGIRNGSTDELRRSPSARKFGKLCVVVSTYFSGEGPLLHQSFKDSPCKDDFFKKTKQTTLSCIKTIRKVDRRIYSDSEGPQFFLDQLPWKVTLF